MRRRMRFAGLQSASISGLSDCALVLGRADVCARAAEQLEKIRVPDLFRVFSMLLFAVRLSCREDRTGLQSIH